MSWDCQAWEQYPQHRWLFNKMELALKLGYAAGPGGTAVPKHGDYVVRPIYNLSGMGVGARRVQLTTGDFSTVKPGEFWCQYFHGPNISIDYIWEQMEDGPILRPVFASEGYRTGPDLYRFNAWKKINPPHWQLPEFISELQDVPRINIEFIHDKIIEIHLRGGVDFPEGATELIPVWSDMSNADCQMFERRGYNFCPDSDDADGHLEIYRLGFFYR